MAKVARKATRTRRRDRKNVEKGAAHIRSTFNNTIVTITDTAGNAIELLLSDILGTDNDVICRGIEEEVDRSLLRSALGTLSRRERDIMVMRFGLGTGKTKTQKEVADMMGISQSYISRLEKRIIKRLKREIVKMS